MTTKTSPAPAPAGIVVTTGIVAGPTPKSKRNIVLQSS